MPMTKNIEIDEDLFNTVVKEYSLTEEEKRDPEMKPDYDVAKWKSRAVKIRRFQARELLDVQRNAFQIKMSSVAGNAVQSSDPVINSDAIQLRTILNGVLEAPWPVKDVEAVRCLPTEIFNWILEEINSFNRLEVKKKS